jgi:hypothetical protein
MSEHEWATENLSDHVAGTMTAEESQRLALHLAECAGCSRALAEWRLLDDSLTQLFADARPAAAAQDRVIQRLRTVRRPRPWIAIGAGLAAAVLVGALGAGMQHFAAGDLPLPGSGLFAKLSSSKASAGKPPSSAVVVDSSDSKFDGSRVRGLDVVNFQQGYLTPQGASEPPKKYFRSNNAWQESSTNLFFASNSSEIPASFKTGRGTISDSNEILNDFGINLGWDASRGHPSIFSRTVPVDPLQNYDFLNTVARQGNSTDLAGFMGNLPPGRQAVTIPISSEQIAGGFSAVPNSRVDITASVQNQGPRVILQNVPVLASGQATLRDQGGKPTLGEVVTVALTPEDALKLETARSKGTLSMLTRPLGDSSQGKVGRVTWDDITGNKKDKGLELDSDVSPSQPLPSLGQLVIPRIPPNAESIPGTNKMILSEEGRKDDQGKMPELAIALRDRADIRDLKKIVIRPSGNVVINTDEAPHGGEGKSDKGTDKQPPGPPDDARKIIRTADIDFEVNSFDAAVKAINLLLEPTKKKGGNLSNSKADKLANGKMSGSVVVRVPPEFFDKFIVDLQKIGDLKSQRISGSEVTKQVTDNEGKLRALRITQQQCEKILEMGKGDTKDLIASTILLGSVRNEIEKIVGELEYYKDQVALCTLTIALVEKEIANAAVLVLYEKTVLSYAVEDVKKAQKSVWAAAADLKVRVLKSDLSEQPDGNLIAQFELEVAHENAEKLRGRLDGLGDALSQKVQSSQQTEGGSVLGPERKTRYADVQFSVSLAALASFKPLISERVTLSIVAEDVDKAKDLALAAAAEFKARIVKPESKQQPDGTWTVQFEADVPKEKAKELRKRFDALGDVITQTVKGPDEAEAGRGPKNRPSEAKFNVTLLALANIKPRETFNRKLACRDILGSVARLKEEVANRKGWMPVNPQVNETAQAKSLSATLEFSVPSKFQVEIDKLLTELGDVVEKSMTPAGASDNATAKKVGYKLTLVTLASQPPREAAMLTVEVKDVKTSLALVKSMFNEKKGTITFDQGPFDDKGEVKGLITCVVASSAKNELVNRIEGMGIVKSQNFVSDPQAPESSLPLAVVAIQLIGTPSILPNEDGIGPEIRKSLYYAFKLLAISFMFIVLGVCVLLPWTVVIFVAVKLVRRFRGY